MTAGVLQLLFTFCEFMAWLFTFCEQSCKQEPKKELNLRGISKKRVKDFWGSPNCADSQGPLEAWYSLVSNRRTAWTCWADLKRDYPRADTVGDCVVFDVGGNKYRLIARVRFPVFVYVLKGMTHAEYDSKGWQSECGCFDEPTKAKKKRASKRLATKYVIAKKGRRK
ncbi:MAG: hypothetical protein Aurels2KO_39770 [Aureliella sp.]